MMSGAAIAQGQFPGESRGPVALVFGARDSLASQKLRNWTPAFAGELLAVERR
jgi:hypothetical protein